MRSQKRKRLSQSEKPTSHSRTHVRTADLFSSRARTKFVDSGTYFAAAHGLIADSAKRWTAAHESSWRTHQRQQTADFIKGGAQTSFADSKRHVCLSKTTKLARSWFECSKQALQPCANLAGELRAQTQLYCRILFFRLSEDWRNRAVYFHKSSKNYGYAKRGNPISGEEKRTKMSLVLPGQRLEKCCLSKPWPGRIPTTTSKVILRSKLLEWYISSINGFYTNTAKTKFTWLNIITHPLLQQMLWDSMRYLSTLDNIWQPSATVSWPPQQII